MAQFDVEGFSIEVEGVDEDSLPSSFDFDEVWEMAGNGANIQEMTQYIHAQSWEQSSRSTSFWNEWYSRQ